MTAPRIVFAGTPDFAVSAFAALQSAGHPIVAVYTQPDRPAGRGRKPQPSAVKQQAQCLGIPVEQPATFAEPGALERLQALEPDLLIVVAYGLLLPRDVLDIPRLGCINLHASLLPRWRGAAPIQRAILAGDARTGIDLMQMDTGLDTGPIYARREVTIGSRETAGALHDRLAALGARLLLDSLPEILAGNLTPEPQSEDDVTYANKLSKAEACIDWTQTALALDRHIRAFNPWPIAHTLLEGEPLRIWTAEIRDEESSDAAPGEVIGCGREGIDVGCGQGQLRITELQPAGKRVMSAADFLNARSLSGLVLG